MNSVLRRSLLRPSNSAVLHRQLLTSPRISHSRRQYSTHNSDAFKDKSAVGVRHSDLLAPSPSPALLSMLSSPSLKYRFSPLKRLPFSFLPAPASIFTSGGKSNGCKSKGVSRPVHHRHALVYILKDSEQKRRWNRAPLDVPTSVGRLK
jgi:hypothetical protein